MEPRMDTNQYKYEKTQDSDSAESLVSIRVNSWFYSSNPIAYIAAARRRTVERIGLPQVRNYRLNLLAQEERSFQEQLNQKAHAYPDMVPLLVIRVEGGGHE